MAEEVFKNIQVLKGVPVNEFMGTMGVFSAALGMSCEDCHAANDSKWENYAADTSERKRTARRMVAMMIGINKAYFGGKQVVTCYSCHRGGDHPKATVSRARSTALRLMTKAMKLSSRLRMHHRPINFSTSTSRPWAGRRSG